MTLASRIIIVFDNTLTLKPRINTVCKSAYFHIRRIARIRKHLIVQAIKTIVHSLISPRLDYCNSVLAGLPDCEITKLQSVQNAAAKLITLSRKFDHVTPILRELHWLPVHQHILFKVLVLVYKALHSS